MTTFSLVNSASDEEACPGDVVISSPTSGNLLIAKLSERSGVGHTSHDVDDTEGGWTKLFGHDQELSDPNARHSWSVWWKEATGSTPTTIDFDMSTGDTAHGSIYEYSPSAAYDWTPQVYASDDTGTGSTSPQSSGNTSDPGGSDLFVVGGGCWRHAAAAPTSITHSGGGLSSSGTTFGGGANKRSHSVSFAASGQASGAKANSVSWSGSGHEGGAWIAIFSDGEIGGGITGGVLGHHQQHMVLRHPGLVAARRPGLIGIDGQPLRMAA
ncbi:MAG: hypothetical protein GY788_02010 [bacterium]|nr:hypothetical protein [bacterium]